MTVTKRPLKVFLCHASQDKPMIRELSQRLFAEGWIDPWLDEKKLLPGQDWRLKIEEAVETSDIVIICLSNNSVSKEGFVQKELRYAREIALEKLEESIFLIPLRFDDCTVPRGLRFYQWVDYFGEKKDEAYSTLVESLKLRYEQKLILEEHEHIQKEKAKQEIAERIAREKAEHEAIEKAAREKAEREKTEKATQEKLEREAAEKARREKAEREAAVKAAREKAKRDAAGKAKREKAERRTAQLSALREVFSRSFNSFKMAIPKAKPLLRIGGILGIVFVLIWIGSWAMPQFLSSVPTATASITQHPGTTIAVTNSPLPITRTVEPQATSTKTTTPVPTSLPTEITDAKGASMVLVPAGKFRMGSDGGDSDEQPIHPVYLDAFYMDTHEVTNALYQVCVEAGGCTPPQDTSSYTRSSYYGNSQYDDYPVIYVDWNQAQAYCEWRVGSLPTEAQWEKATRGADGHTYPWGEGISCNQANYHDGSKHCVGDTTKVGSYESGKSPYEIYDLAGNVWEWVADWYDSSYYVNSPSSNPLGPNSGQFRVMRGGGWNSYPRDYLRASDRSWYPRGFSDTIGFRCVRSVP